METRFWDLRDPAQWEQGLTDGAETLKRGGLVAFPTETVYGLGADGTDQAAVERIYEAKGRPETKPISLLVADGLALDRLCEAVPEGARKLAAAFWPGPLTMVLKKKACVPAIVTAGGDTVGLRCPDHPAAQALLQMSGVPLATPSANPSGQPSAKCGREAYEALQGRIDCVLEGGPCSVGRESTVVDLTASPVRILRQGALPKEELERILGEVVL